MTSVIRLYTFLLATYVLLAVATAQAAMPIYSSGTSPENHREPEDSCETGDNAPDGNDGEGGGEGETGDPIDVGRMLVFRSYTDVSIQAGNGIALSVVRRYSSRSAHDLEAGGYLSFGPGWLCEYNAVLFDPQDGNYLFYDEKGVFHHLHDDGSHTRWNSLDTQGEEMVLTIWDYTGDGTYLEYVLYRADDSLWVFDAFGRLIFVERNAYNNVRAAERIAITYLSAPLGYSGHIYRIDTVTGPNGRYLKYNYNTSGFPSQVSSIDYVANSTTYTVANYWYDASGYLAFVKEGNTGSQFAVQYEYGSFSGTGLDSVTGPLLGRVTRWSDGNGFPIVAFAYDAYGYAKEEWSYHLASSTWSKRLSISGTFASGNRTVNYHEGESLCTNKFPTIFERDGRGDIKQAEYQCLPTGVHYRTLFFDRSDPHSADRRRLRAVDNMIWSGSAYSYHRTIQYEFVNPSGVDPLYSRRVSAVKRYRTSGGPAFTTSIAYDTAFPNKISTITNPESSITSIAYYNSSTDPSAGHAWSLPKTVTDAEGRTTTFTYDTSGRLASVTYPNGRSRSFSYNNDGFLSSFTDALGHVTSYTYNAFGQPKTATNYLSLITTHYYTVAGDGAPVTHYPPRRYRTRIPGDRDTTATLDADDWFQVTRVEDTLGKEWNYVYDGKGRVVTASNPNGEDRTYVWDRLDRLVEFKDGLNQSTEYVYDIFGRLTKITDDLGRITEMSYSDNSACGNCGTSADLVAWLLDPRGNKTLFSYNLQGMLIELKVKEGAGSPIIIAELDYDDSGDLVEVVDHRLEYSSVDMGDQTFRYQFDDTGRLLSETYPTGRTIQIEYDSAGRPSRTKSIHGHVMNSAYDSLSRPDSATDAFGGVIDFQYYTTGDDRLKKIVRPNDAYTEYVYDGWARLDKIEHRDDSAALIAQFDFTRNDRDLITRIDRVGGYYDLYAYDDAYRLESEARKNSSDATIRSIAYDFDDAANRVERTSAQLGDLDYTPNALNQIASSTNGVATTAYTYDNAGNLIEKRHGTSMPYPVVWSATYRPGDDRMVSVTTGSGTSYYVYDVFGRRVMKVAPGGGSTLYYYSGLEVVAEETALNILDNDERVLLADEETSTSAAANGWGPITVSSATPTNTYTTDSLRGNVLRTTVTPGAKGFPHSVIGDKPGGTYNPNDSEWNYPGQVFGLWFRNADASPGSYVPMIEFYCAASTGTPTAATLRYVFGSGTNAWNNTDKIATIYLGSTWAANQWHYLTRNVVVDIQTVMGLWAYGQVDGMAIYGRDLYVDDIVLDVRARTVDRHGGAEWTPGASSWPSGGLAKDVAVYNHYDHLGNLAVQTDATGASIATWDYDAFGNVVATTGTATTANYRHTKNHFDPDAGLFYFNHRWYDPSTGRFSQRHTPFQPLREHPYAVSEGNPIAWVDPWGLSIELEELNLPITGGNLDHTLPFSHLCIVYTDDDGKRHTLAGWKNEGGLLEGVKDYEQDLDEDKDGNRNNDTETVTPIKPPKEMDESRYFDLLTQMVDEYNKNKLEYTTLPILPFSGYNSNSFAHGLVDHSGGTFESSFAAHRPQYPGSMFPVPRKHFFDDDGE